MKNRDFFCFNVNFQWESKVERGQENFDKISQMIKREMERFEKCRIQDFKVMFIKYLENHLEHQAKVRIEMMLFERVSRVFSSW